MKASSTGPGSKAKDNDLLIVGPGVLGRLVAANWHERFPTARIVAESRTPASHGALHSVLPFLELRVAQTSTPNSQRFRHVVFCAPPNQNEDYLGAVRRTVEQYWSGVEDTATFVFTSSIGVYREPPTTDALREDAPVVSDAADPGASPSALKLLACEEVVRAAHGTVLRLAGLYTLDRGPHRFWLSRGKVHGAPDGLINLVSYHDAARAVIAALERPQLRGETLLVVDNQPLSRREICEIARQHPLYSSYAMPAFVENQGSLNAQSSGKRFDAHRSRAKLGEFKYDFESFAAFIDQVMSEKDVFGVKEDRPDRV
jgi:nucleoside-diphosphate-sugar epimerase